MSLPELDVMPGAEPWSADGGAAGALVLHGFTGNPSSMRGLAEALAGAGFAVELPRLPGHGTRVEDMMATTFADWLGEAEAAYQRLASRCEKVVAVGLSMGGALVTWLASDHPEVAGAVFINALASVPEGMQEAVEGMLAQGMDRMDGIGSDIADPDAHESAYAETPLVPLRSLFAVAPDVPGRLRRITCPSLVITSVQDHVVDPSDSDIIATSVRGPVERLRLERSFHVATQDYDKGIVESATVDFARKVTG